MEKRIYINADIRAYLMRTTGKTDRMIQKACAFESDSDLAKKIRVMALQKGGVLVGVQWDTEFDSAERKMIQRLGGMVQIVVSFDGWWQFWVNGKLRQCGDGLSFCDLEGLQLKGSIAVACSGMDK